MEIGYWSPMWGHQIPGYFGPDDTAEIERIEDEILSDPELIDEALCDFKLCRQEFFSLMKRAIDPITHPDNRSDYLIRSTDLLKKVCGAYAEIKYMRELKIAQSVVKARFDRLDREISQNS